MLLPNLKKLKRALVGHVSGNVTLHVSSAMLMTPQNAETVVNGSPNIHAYLFMVHLKGGVLFQRGLRLHFVASN
mgnify:CR=1 FL=1